MGVIKKINGLSRKRQTALFAVIVLILAGFRLISMRGRVFLSPEAVMYACERGLHYGPSEKVLKVECQGRNALVIGKYDGGLSSVRATKGLLFWRLGYDGDGTSIEGDCPTDTVDAWYDEDFGLLYGVSELEDVKKVTVAMGEGDEEYFSMTLDADRDGFFCGKPEDYDRNGDEWPYVISITGYGKDGNLIYANNFLGEEIFDSDGSLIYSSLEEYQGAETN